MSRSVFDRKSRIPRPSTPGILKSETIRSTTSPCSSRRIASAPSPAHATSYPSPLKSIERTVHMFFSSSTISIRFISISHRMIWKVAPFPGVESTLMVPLCCSMIRCAMESPRPVPEVFVVKNGMKIRCR